MKIPASIRRLYSEQLEINTKLQNKVDERLKNLKRKSWHYDSRLKSEQSFALKIESGRAKYPKAVEDFFACTIVVRNSTEIDEAEELVKKNFSIHERRPKHKNFTHKSPQEFPFDDLRLYVRWKDDPDLPPSGVSAVNFEVQIKTFLQHAWSIATHDLVYKTDTVSWGKERIAFQVKAMLEHAEMSIQDAERLSESDSLAKTDSTTTTLKNYIQLLTSQWQAPDLPKDIKRLAENVCGVMEVMKFGLSRLEDALNVERERGRGPLVQNLSPYGVVLQTMMTEYPKEFMAALMNDHKYSQRIVIPPELQLLDEIDKSLCRNAIFLDPI